MHTKRIRAFVCLAEIDLAIIKDNQPKNATIRLLLLGVHETWMDALSKPQQFHLPRMNSLAEF